jgi:hypothetical protein
MSAIAMDDLLLAKSFVIRVDLALTWVNSARGLGFSADLTEVNSNALRVPTLAGSGISMRLESAMSKLKIPHNQIDISRPVSSLHFAPAQIVRPPMPYAGDRRSVA